AGLRWSLFGFLAFALRRLAEFLDDAGALELGDVVDEQHAVEMVDLVLQAGRQQPVRLDLLLVAGKIGVADAYLRRALDLLIIFRNRQTAFLVGRALLRCPDELRIDVDLRVSRLLPLCGIHCGDARFYAHPDWPAGQFAA